MSLINDALKRAKQSQSHPTPTPAPHLEFRPVETEVAIRRGFGLLLPIVLALIALVGLFFVWELAHQTPKNASQPELVVRAVSTTPAPIVPVPPVEPPPPAISEPVPAAPVVSEPPPPATVAADPAEPAPAEPVTATTPPPVADEPPAPPKPAPLRLQAIVFNPSQPSAMINGKTLFVGDKVGEFRVDAITQNSATLINAGQTNLLELAQ